MDGTNFLLGQIMVMPFIRRQRGDEQAKYGEKNADAHKAPGTWGKLYPAPGNYGGATVIAHSQGAGDGIDKAADTFHPPEQNYRPTISALSPEIAPSISLRSCAGTLNLSRVAFRSFTEACQSSSVIPRPVWAVFISCP